MNRIDKDIASISRGAVDIISAEELRKKLSSPEPLRIKFGVDPTAPDLHLGHTVVLNKLKTFQSLGHKIVFIIGDFTAKIGDPTGRSELRPQLDEKEILKNAKTYTEQVFKILDKSKTEVTYNSHWLYTLGVDGILKLTSQSSVAQMLHRADFKERFKNDADITILEFIYPLLQGYDSVAIKADIELGGTDQKFNLLMGRQLQKDAGISPQIVITMPILEGTDGVRKMSKSYGNYIALNDPPNEMYGKIMSISDTLMHRYYELLTDVNLEEVKKTHPRSAKANLARTIVETYHGPAAATEAAEEFERVFKDKDIPKELREFVLEKKSVLLSELLYISGLASSKSDAKRLLSQNAVKINSEKISEDIVLEPKNDFVLQSGKKNFVRIRV